MKKSLLFFLLIISSSAFSQRAFNVLEATSQAWSGGRVCTGSGINYRVKFVTKFGSDKISFDTLWIKDRFYPINQLFNGNTEAKNFETGDTLYFQVAFRSYYSECMPINYSEDYNVGNPPIDFDGDAILQYAIKGIRGFSTIDTLVRLPYLAYP